MRGTHVEPFYLGRLLGFENMGFCVPNGETLNWKNWNDHLPVGTGGWSSIHHIKGRLGFGMGRMISNDDLTS